MLSERDSHLPSYVLQTICLADNCDAWRARFVTPS
jgi:hypothetical protein